ncbi:hypothetical protein SRHO_G00263720 [Serrasalmus rhombeus]
MPAGRDDKGVDISVTLTWQCGADNVPSLQTCSVLFVNLQHLTESLWDSEDLCIVSLLSTHDAPGLCGEGCGLRCVPPVLAQMSSCRGLCLSSAHFPPGL